MICNKPRACLFDPILDRVSDTPIIDGGGGGQKGTPRSLTLPFGV